MTEPERRIEKFRAWNEEYKTMDYDGGFLFDLSDFNIDHYKYLSLNIFINKIAEELRLMRFIGAHDRQGKELYEEDIVKWKEQIKDTYVKRNDYIYGVVIWDREECRFVISQITRGAHMIGDNTFAHDTQFYSHDGAQFNWEDLEIVGNMYENADIYEKLKQEKDNVGTYL